MGNTTRTTTGFGWLIIVGIFAGFFLLPQGLVSGQPTIKWSKLETRHTVIHYQSKDDLSQLRRKLHFGPGSGSFLSLFSSNDDNDDISEIKGRVDAIFERVQEILGMKKAMAPVIINLYSNEEQLHKAYKEIYGTKCRIRAWYRHKDKTIYLNIRDLHEGMLAHEMAHFVIDNYLEVTPPRATAEILARYVDLHLKD